MFDMTVTPRKPWETTHRAIENEESIEGITELLDIGAVDVNLSGSARYLEEGAGDLETALAVAASSRQMDTVLLLLDQGANIDQVGGRYGTALAAAAFGGSADIVSLLLDRGADINAVGNEYWNLFPAAVGTALAVAAFGGSTDIVSLLLNRGANTV